MLYPLNFIVFDLETGGLSSEKNPVVEIATVIVNSKLEVIEEYESLIKPYGNLVIEQQALQANGISIDEINGGQDIKIVVQELITMFKKLKSGKFAKPVLVGHNIAKFDMDFIISMFQFVGKDVFEFVDRNIEDTIYLSRYKWGLGEQIANFQLTTCCNKAGIDLVQAHRALPDTKATAQLFIYFMKCLRGEGGKIDNKNDVKVREVFKF